MDILFLFFFYTIPASLFFVYGIGLEQLILNTRLQSFSIDFIGKNMLHMVSAASIIWLIQSAAFLPVQFSFLLPLSTGIILFLCEIIIQMIFTKTIIPQTKERIFSYGTVFFAVFFACSYAEMLIIILSACSGLLIWSCILYGIRLRMDETKISAQLKNAPLIFIAMGIIALALSAWNNAGFLYLNL